MARKTYYGEEAELVSDAVLERNLKALRESKDVNEFFVDPPKMPAHDREMRLSETTGLLKTIATAMVGRHSFYTFTDTASGQKVLVLK